MALAAVTAANSPASNGDRYVAPASVKSSWQACNSDFHTVNTASLLRPDLATGASNIIPLTIPFGVTRCLVRLATPAGTATAVTYTTQPLVVLYSSDANGIAQRVDSNDASAAGINFGASDATAVSNAGDTARYWNASSLTGYDLLGGTTFYALISQASAGANFVGSVQVLFLN